MPPKSFTPKKVVGAVGKVSSSAPSTRRKSTSRTEIVDEGDSDNGDNETTENNRRSSRSARVAECASAALRTRSSRSSAAAKTESTASTSKDDGKRLTIQFGDSPDDSSDASVVSVGLSSDEEVVGSSSKKKNNSIPFCEVEKAAIDRLNNLSRYRKIFEPFVTPKVMAQLNNVLIEKQRRNQEGGVANSKGAAASTSAVGTEDTEDRFATERLPQPRCLSPICKMRDYQLEGFSWLVNNYHRSVNCILADEMGLGKTLQSIACVAHLALVKKLSGPYLFIVPLSVLFNWMNEFKKWCPALKVVRLHSNDKDEQLRLRKVLSNPDVAQIVVTTYDAVKTGGLHHALRCIVWRSVFLDEGHRIKNEDADVTRACHALRTRFRVILTGTPVQNNLHEFGALLSFLAPNIFTDLSLFDAAFKLNVRGPRKDSGRQSNNKNFSSKKKDAETVKEEQAAAQQIDRALLENAHYMMKPFVLRRLKSEVEQKLPPKYETKINCPMTEVQKELTRALLFKEQALISKLDSTITAPADQVAAAEKMEESGSGAAEMIDKSKLMSLLAQLRKAANHPYLFPGVEKVAVDGLPTEEIVAASGKMQVLDKLLSQLYAKGHRVVLFSQYTRTLDILSDYLDMRGYKHSRLDGSTNRVMREVRINLFNKPQSPQFVFCLSTRAGGEGVNLFTADTVILYDSDWNPQVDIQAMARVHRIGQTKIVHVYRLISAGSVEECIVQRAQRKLFLDSMVNRGSTAQAQQEAEAAAQAAQEAAQKQGATAKATSSATAAAAAAKTAEEEKEEVEEEEGAAKPQQVGGKRKRGSANLPPPEAGARSSSRVKSARLSSGGAADDANAEQPTLATASTTAVASTEEDDPAAASATAATTEEDAEESEPSKVFSAVRFGWNSVFSVNKNASKELSDADIERIIDRTRGSSSEGTDGARAEEAAAPSEGWQENQEYSLETFNEHAPLVSIHDLRVQETATTTAVADADDDGAAAESSGAGAGAGGSKKAMRRSSSAASMRSNASFEIPSDPDMTSGAAAGAGVTEGDDAAASASSRPRRSLSARTVDVMVEGVGLVKVSKFSLDPDDSATSGNKSAQDRRAARQAKQQEVLYITHSGRQVAGRDYEHQDMCNECWDGGELLVCDVCPMAFHPQCIGLSKMPSGSLWFCPHHQCATCARRVSAAALLFRCECCSEAYCEDCLPAESTVQGESRRLEALGYRMSGNACYILCSLECRRFYETEVEPPTDAGDAPHQRQIVQPYISAEKETGNENASTSSSSSVGKGAVADAAAGVGDKGDVSDDKLSDEYGAPLMSNLDHALNNCALEDIRDRLGFARATPPALLPSAVVAPPTDSTATSTAAAAAAITTTTTAAASTSGDLSTTANASSNGITAFATVPTASITPVLSNVNSRLKVRFTCLGEIPNFHLRLEKAGPRVKSLLFKLINDIMLYQQRLMDKAKEKEGAKADTAAGAAEKPPAAAAAAADEAEESDEESVNMERVKKDAYNHKGVHPSLAAEDIGRVFLHTVGTIARAQKFELFPLAEALGLGFVSPIIRNLNNKPSSDSEVANNIARFLLEPKFSVIKEYNRQKLEEAIAAMLVLPCPQNLLIYKSGLENRPPNGPPVDNLFLLSRYLECLGEHCTDGNSLYFASLTAKSKGMTQLRHWPAFYPLGSMAPQHLRNQWLAPAARLFFFLNQPYLLEDRTLRQTLQNVHRALYTPQGLPKPPVVAAASVAAPANITSLPPRAPNYAVDSSGSDSDFRKPGVVNPQPKQYQAPVPYQQPQVRHAQAQQQMMSQQSMPQYPSMSQYPADPQQEQLINNLNITMPAMDPKKELDLYMKWLNVRYDALNKIAAAAAQAAAAGVPSNTATSATRPPNSIPMFPVTQAQRQSMMERISLHLRTVLMRRDAAAVVECVRRCEYELLLQAADFNEYQNDYNMGQRIVEVVNAHPEWRIPPVKLNVHGMIEFMSDAEVAARNATAAGNWRSLITPAIRQEMIARVEKMLKMVSNKLNIISKEDLDYKTQQYEMGLVISATSFAEYMDKATMPKRLANLVTDFADHKRTLPPEVFSTYLA